MPDFRKHKALLASVLLFGLLYSLISLVNHYLFRTYALDLGAYTNALYDYIHLQWNDSTVFKVEKENLLADHFDLYLMLFAPLSLIFGTYSLLVVQIAAILWGGIGVYSYFKASEQTRSLALHACLYFYGFFGVFTAISYDYHSNVIAATLVPWLFYLIKTKRLLGASLLILLMLVSKENMALWIAFVCAGLAIEYWKDRLRRNYLLIAAIASGIAFIAITTWIMPVFSTSNAYPHFHYSYLGANYSEAIIHLISHPLEALQVMFTNHSLEPDGDFVKLELFILLTLTGLPILLRKPQFLLMLIPIFFQKLFHDKASMWGIGGQYSIEFAPIMAIGIFLVLAQISDHKRRDTLGRVVLTLALLITFKTMDSSQSKTDKTRLRFYQARHYQRDYAIDKAREQLAIIPPQAIVSAQSPFVPHLALRDHVYQFPIIKDAEYIVFSNFENSYPMSQEGFEQKTSGLMNSKDWQLNFDGDIKVLKRITPSEPHP